MTTNTIILEITPLEAAHLSGLVAQFIDLLDSSEPGMSSDPAIRRLVPDAYEDPDDAREFRTLTESDLLMRRRLDAADLVASLSSIPELAAADDGAAAMDGVVVVLDPDAAQAWLRTLAAVRLVLATRLGISTEDDHDDDDPRFGIYDWLGFRLDGLVRAIQG